MNINISKISRRLALAVAASAMMATTAAHAVPVYNITDLGTLGGRFSRANDINDSGQVTGAANIAGDTASHAFISDATTHTLTDIAFFGSSSGLPSEGNSINASGQVTGQRNLPFRDGAGLVPHAFIWDGFTDLGTLGGRGSTGYGINDSGQATGISNISGIDFFTAEHAFIGDANPLTGLTDLNTLGGPVSQGIDINNSGQVTGDAMTSGFQFHAFIGDAAGLTDLGTLGGTSSQGRGINDSGQVTGFSDTSAGAIHAFTWDATGFTDLGTLAGDTSSKGQDINNIGQVVGVSSSATGDRAFLWDSGTMFDLNSLIDAADPLNGIFTLDIANGINSFGEIVGTGTNSSGLRHAFLLTVRTPSGAGGGGGTLDIVNPPPTNSVPEPAPLALLGFGLLGLGFMRKRRG